MKLLAELLQKKYEDFHIELIGSPGSIVHRIDVYRPIQGDWRAVLVFQDKIVERTFQKHNNIYITLEDPRFLKELDNAIKNTFG